MSTIKVDTVRPVTTDADLTLQGDASGAGVTGAKVFGDGSLGADSITDLAGTGAPDFPNGLTLAGNTTGGSVTGVTLDDYEEGTWTPQLTDNQSPPNEFAYDSTPKGKYTKIGDLVTVFFQARTDGSTSGITTSDQLYMRSLPFINESTTPTITAYSIVRIDILNTNQSTVGPIFARLDIGTDSVRFEHQFGDLSAPYSIQSLSISEFEGGSAAEVQGSLTYKTE